MNSRTANLTHLPLRLAIGAFFLNSGLEKRTLEEQPAVAIHSMAVSAVPPIKHLKPTTFARLLAGSEIAIGAALVVPVVPSIAVGAALCGFSAGLLRLYWATPGTHRPGDPRPTQAGIPLAKDIWLFGAGMTLILDDLMNRNRRPPARRHGRGPSSILGRMVLSGKYAPRCK
jgi:uncharacterized membrane protein YphA (DoxX/SURF4 family)